MRPVIVCDEKANTPEGRVASHKMNFLNTIDETIDKSQQQVQSSIMQEFVSRDFEPYGSKIFKDLKCDADSRSSTKRDEVSARSDSSKQSLFKKRGSVRSDYNDATERYHQTTKKTLKKVKTQIAPISYPAEETKKPAKVSFYNIPGQET